MRIGITKSANVTPLCCLLALKQMHGAHLMPLHLSHLQCQNGCPYHYYPFTDYLIFLPVIILVRKHGCMFLSTHSSPVHCAEPAGHIITASQSYSNMSNLTMGQQNETTQKNEALFFRDLGLWALLIQQSLACMQEHVCTHPHATGCMRHMQNASA